MENFPPESKNESLLKNPVPIFQPDNIWGRRVILLIFIVYFISYLPSFLYQTKLIDTIENATIPPGDDADYQVLAINLLHGFGFTDQVVLPLKDYNLASSNPFDIASDQPFYRAPGFPIALSFTYALFGEHTLNARYIIALSIWLVSLLLLLIGDQLAGWMGALAGGIAGYYSLHFGSNLFGLDGFSVGRFLTEPLATFWIVVSAFLIVLYFKKKRARFLYLAAFSLTCLVLTRANFLLTIPFFLAYFYLKNINRKHIAIFGLISLLPIIAWSIYASISVGQPVLLTTQGSIDFPRFNNKEVINGFGPERINRGGWQPGFAYQNGQLIITDSNRPQPGENGWLIGLSFWFENPKLLPRLFYAKLQAGFLFGGFTGFLYLAGISFMLLMTGFSTRKWGFKWFNSFSPKLTIAIQIALLILILVFWSRIPFYQTIILWSVILIIAFMFPYGTTFKPPFLPVDWFFPFLASYLVSVLLYGGYERFHYPLDPLLIMITFYGFFYLLYILIPMYMGNLLRPELKTQA